jgi:hypothetical protein
MYKRGSTHRKTGAAAACFFSVLVTQTTATTFMQPAALHAYQSATRGRDPRLAALFLRNKNRRFRTVLAATVTFRQLRRGQMKEECNASGMI